MLNTMCPITEYWSNTIYPILILWIFDRWVLHVFLVPQACSLPNCTGVLLRARIFMPSCTPLCCAGKLLLYMICTVFFSACSWVIFNITTLIVFLMMWYAPYLSLRLQILASGIIILLELVFQLSIHIMESSSYVNDERPTYVMGPYFK